MLVHCVSCIFFSLFCITSLNVVCFPPYITHSLCYILLLLHYILYVHLLYVYVCVYILRIISRSPQSGNAHAASACEQSIPARTMITSMLPVRASRLCIHARMLPVRANGQGMNVIILPAGGQSIHARTMNMFMLPVRANGQVARTCYKVSKNPSCQHPKMNHLDSASVPQ